MGISDHSIVYLDIHLNNKPRNTLWRLNIGLLNNKSAVEEIKKEIRESINDNKDDQVDPTIIWDTVKSNQIKSNFIYMALFIH